VIREREKGRAKREKRPTPTAEDGRGALLFPKKRCPGVKGQEVVKRAGLNDVRREKEQNLEGGRSPTREKGR